MEKKEIKPGIVFCDQDTPDEEITTCRMKYTSIKKDEALDFTLYGTDENLGYEGSVPAVQEPCTWVQGNTGSPQQACMLSPKQQQELYQKQCVSAITAQEKLYVETVKHHNKMELEEKKTENECKVLEQKGKSSLDRDLMSVSVCEDADGYLLAVIKDKENKVVASSIICSERYIQLTEVYAYGKKGEYSVYALSWGDQPDGPGIFFTKDGLTPLNLKRAFMKQGICIHDAKAYRNKLMEAIITHLRKACLSREIALSEGWNKKNGVWIFVPHGKATMRGAIKYVQ